MCVAFRRASDSLAFVKGGEPRSYIRSRGRQTGRALKPSRQKWAGLFPEVRRYSEAALGAGRVSEAITGKRT
jgi:hypothetical protein